jgi:hypothetical protein
MMSQEIKKDCEQQYKNIRKAENRLKVLRKQCKHENTFEGNYSYRVGASARVIICSDCGEFIKSMENMSWEQQ